MKYRIKEEMGIFGKKIFVPEYFNEYSGHKLLRIFADHPDEWVECCHMVGCVKIRQIFYTLEEAQEFLQDLIGLPRYYYQIKP